MATILHTEKVTENVAWNNGTHAGMKTVTFWVAYPAHVVGYGQMSDRVSACTGRGKTRREALAAAGGQPGLAQSVSRPRLCLNPRQADGAQCVLNRHAEGRPHAYASAVDRLVLARSRIDAIDPMMAGADVKREVLCIIDAV